MTAAVTGRRLVHVHAKPPRFSPRILIGCYTDRGICDNSAFFEPAWCFRGSHCAIDCRETDSHRTTETLRACGTPRGHGAELVFPTHSGGRDHEKFIRASSAGASAPGGPHGARRLRGEQPP